MSMPAHAARAPSSESAAKAEEWLFELSYPVAVRLRAQWRAAREAEGDFAADFYGTLFRIAPEVAGLFPGDMSVQQRRLTETLDDAVGLFGEPSQLVRLMRAAGARHHHYHVRDAHFAVMEDALIETLAERLGVAFDDSAAAEWREIFGKMALVMRRAMADAART